MELGARVNEFFYIESKTEKKNGGRGGAEGCRSTDRRPNQLFASSTFSKLGA